jgi:TolA-binding protein
MARDLAATEQEIEQLEANIEQLKANQEQMSRDVAKASEQNRRRKVSASPPRSAAAPPRKPMPFRPSQGAVASGQRFSSRAVIARKASISFAIRALGENPEFRL